MILAGAEVTSLSVEMGARASLNSQIAAPVVQLVSPRTWMSCGVTLIVAFLACLAVGTVVDRANLWVVVVFSQT